MGLDTTIQIRVSSQVKEFLRATAHKKGMTLSDFVLEGALRFGGREPVKGVEAEPLMSWIP